MTVIDLGEPGHYEPGEAPVLRGYRLLPPQRRRKAAAALALVVAAGGLAGIGPTVAADPQVHHIGRIRGQFTEIFDDTVVSYDDQQAEITAYTLDGSGPRWRLSADQPPGDVTVAGTQVIISFLGLSFRDSRTNTQTDLPFHVDAVDAATGQRRWSVAGAPLTPVSAAVVAVVTGPTLAERIKGVDTATGQTLWEQPLNGIAVNRLESGGRQQSTDELVVVAPDGAVQVMAIATGRIRAAGRVKAGAQPLFEWQDLLGVWLKEPSPDGPKEFAVYRLGTDRPLWQKTTPANGPTFSPCDNQLCSYDSSGYDRWDPLTGRLVAAFNPDAPDPYRLDTDPWQDWYGATGLGRWEPIAMYAGHMLVRLDPSFARDAQSWLGEATLHGRKITVRPLMAIGPRANSCSVGERWFFCDGSAVEDAVSVRLSELDSLLAR